MHHQQACHRPEPAIVALAPEFQLYLAPDTIADNGLAPIPLVLGGPLQAQDQVGAPVQAHVHAQGQGQVQPQAQVLLNNNGLAYDALGQNNEQNVNAQNAPEADHQ
ncbi:hypothetical protein BGZ83_000544 [Gryganskiella cystojenkinii]|nr:hypothetical protein BGZ83_000544 [Gryganskiella cystojenkinii]